MQKALLSQEGITEDGMATAEDYGDYLLRFGKVDKDKYEKSYEEVNQLLKRRLE